MELIHGGRGHGKTRLCVEQMLEPGNEQSIYIACTSMRAQIAYDMALHILEGRGQKPAPIARQSLKFRFVHVDHYREQFVGRLVEKIFLDDVEDVLARMLGTLSIVATTSVPIATIEPPITLPPLTTEGTDHDQH